MQDVAVENAPPSDTVGFPASDEEQIDIENDVSDLTAARSALVNPISSNDGGVDLNKDSDHRTFPSVRSY